MSVPEALLLIGHGSVRYPNASDPMQRHAATLRAGPWPGPVQVAVLNGSPTVRDALAAITATVIRVVPFFMEDGYFTRVAIPRTLEAQAGADGTTRHELRTGDGHHHHYLICRTCHKVEPVDDCVVERLEEEIAAERGYTAMNHSLQLTGVCPTCQKSRAARKKKAR